MSGKAETGPAAVPPRRPLAEGERRIVILGVLIAMLLAALDQASVAPAVALIGTDLGNVEFLPWVVSAYFVTATAVTTLYGKIADLHGRRPTLFAAVAVFLVGSVVSAAAPDMSVLIAGRAIQGLGGGGLLVLAMTVIGDVVPPIERAQYAAFVSGAWAFASIAGPVLGGLIAEHVQWRAIFLFNLPLGALAIAISAAPLGRLPWQRREHRLDVPGAILIVSATVALMLALTWGGPRRGWTAPATLALAAAAAMLGGAFVWRLRRAAEPLIPLGVLASRTVAAATSASFCIMGAYTGLTLFLPIYFKTVYGLSPSEAGLALIPYMAGAVIGSMGNAQVMVRMPRYRLSAAFGMLVAAAGLAVLAFGWSSLPLLVVAAVTLFVGIGLGTNFPVTSVSVQNAVAVRDLGAATGLLQFTRSLGSAIGIAGLGAAAALSGVAASISRTPPAAAAAAPQADFAPLFLLAAAGALAGLACLLMIEDKPLRGS